MVVGSCSDSAFGSRQGPELLTVEHFWGGLPKPPGSKCLGFPAKENSELLALASDFVGPFIGIPLPRHWADLWTHKVTGPALTVTGTGLRWRWHKPGVKVTVVLSLQRNVVQPGVRTEASSGLEGLGVLSWVPATASAMRVTGLAVVPIHPRVSVY